MLPEHRVIVPGAGVLRAMVVWSCWRPRGCCVLGQDFSADAPRVGFSLEFSLSLS